MQNPFENIQVELVEIKSLVTQLLNKPEEDYTHKLYTIKEAASLLKVDRQTVRNHINRGTIKATGSVI